MVREAIKQGDIIKLSLNPTRGHEQAGYRPVLVVSNASLSRASNMTIVCPITNTDRRSPVHVRLDNTDITGFVMCDQMRAIDIRTRDYTIVGTVDEETLWEVCDIVQGAVDIEGLTR
jgi:mRNA interferase MazF